MTQNRPARALSSAQLLDPAFPDTATVIDRTIDSHIKNIRNNVRALSGDRVPIHTVFGVDCAFDGCSPSSSKAEASRSSAACLVVP